MQLETSLSLFASQQLQPPSERNVNLAFLSLPNSASQERDQKTEKEGAELEGPGNSAVFNTAAGVITCLSPAVCFTSRGGGEKVTH